MHTHKKKHQCTEEEQKGSIQKGDISKGDQSLPGKTYKYKYKNAIQSVNHMMEKLN